MLKNVKTPRIAKNMPNKKSTQKHKKIGVKHVKKA